MSATLLRAAAAPRPYGRARRRAARRRAGWLRAANPPLAALLTELLGGEAWASDPAALAAIAPHAGEPVVRELAQAARDDAKRRLADHLRRRHGLVLDPDALLAVQAAPAHAAARHALGVLHLVWLYHTLRQDRTAGAAPYAALFVGPADGPDPHAALALTLARRLADAVDREPHVRGRLRVLVLPTASCTPPGLVVAAADVAEHLAPAGPAAPAAAFMLNGALAVGPRSGGGAAAVAAAVGEEHCFLFGPAAPAHAPYDPYAHYRRHPVVRPAVDLVAGGRFSAGERGAFEPLLDELLTHDPHRVLADLPAYAAAHARLRGEWGCPDGWWRSALLNVAAAGALAAGALAPGALAPGRG